MIDFGIVDGEKVKLADIQARYTHQDLIEATNEVIDAMLEMVAGLPDSYVTFQPEDPLADDPYAAAAEEVSVAWTLGHVIVHATASGEEAAALGASLARGIAFEGRSRYEVPWQTMQTTAQLIGRLEESRRIRLAYLNAWPDQPLLETVKVTRRSGDLNAVGYTLSGLWHDSAHLGQIAEIIRQARQAETHKIIEIE